MDFEDSKEEAEFRAEARNWLGAHAPQYELPHDRVVPEAERLVVARQWQREKAEARFVEIGWPSQHGGRDAPPMHTVIWQQEEARFNLPSGFFEIGLSLCVRCVIDYGSQALIDRYVAPALRGDEIWCQLFSEPSGGSDVAGARTRAQRDGDGWILNGQKVWTTGAHFSDFGIVVARTDPSVPKHLGLTMFAVDMHAPGVDVRPIKQANGEREFNEVFFTDVRIPDSHRLGDVGTGWKAVLSTLMHERQHAAGGWGFPDAVELLQVARTRILEGAPAIRHGAIRNQLVDYWIRSEGVRLTNCRALTALSRGQTPGPEFSLGKLVGAKQGQDVAISIMDLLGTDALRTELPADSPRRLHYGWMWGAAARIAGGTDEIQRNIIAERVLGLPQDVRVDKDVPFDRLPR